MVLFSGNSGKERHGSLMNMNMTMNMSNIHEEYEEAFRSKSYLELSDKVRYHLKIRQTLDVVAGVGHSPLPALQNDNLNGALLEPPQETLVEMTINGESNFHHLLMDYFEVSFEASKICEELLQIIHRNQVNLHIIKSLFKLAKMKCDCTDNSQKSQLHDQIKVEFDSYSRVSNPLSTFNPAKFRDTQNGHGILFKKLASKYWRTRRRMNITRSFKKALVGTLIASSVSLRTTMLSLPCHNIFGTQALSELIGCSFGRNKFKKSQKNLSKKASSSKSYKLDKLNTQLDVAARGVYTLINDLNTISRIGGRLHDEIEHGKAIAIIYVRSGKCPVLKEVLKEFRNSETCYVELLKEFEDQVCLCLVNINRSRRQLVEEEPN